MIHHPMFYHPTIHHPMISRMETYTPFSLIRKQLIEKKRKKKQAEIPEEKKKHPEEFPSLRSCTKKSLDIFQSKFAIFRRDYSVTPQ